MLKRRLNERQLPIRVESTGRGGFRLDIYVDLELETAGTR